MLQREPHPEQRAAAFVKGDVKDADDALKGARDIIAEQVSENERARNMLRNTFARQALLTAKVIKGKEEEAPNTGITSTVRSPEAMQFAPPACHPPRRSGGSAQSEYQPQRRGVCGTAGTTVCTEQQRLREAGGGSRAGCLQASVETVYRDRVCRAKQERADDEAIRVFAENLRQLLLASPLGQKRVMGIDPGFRTGCKVVCLDAQGNLLHNENIYRIRR